MFRSRLALAFALFALATSVRADWKLHKIDGREYVALSEVATFYGFPPPLRLPEKRLGISDGKREMVFLTDSREVRINGINIWLAFPALDRDGEVLVSRMDLGKTVDPALRPQAIKDMRPFKTVVLDPGHGGQDNGAPSSVAYEKNFALDVARRVRGLLQKAGLKVVMTRNADTTLPLETRAAIANKQADAIFVSLHFNSSDNPWADGFEVYSVTPRGAPSTENDELSVADLVAENGNASESQSFALAGAIYHAMHGRLDMTDRGIKRARFAVLRLTSIPAVLLEGGFLSNPADTKRLADKGWRDRYAAAIAEGIMAYKRLAEFHIPPRQVRDYRGIPNPPLVAAPTPTSSPTPTPSVSPAPATSGTGGAETKSP